MGRFQGKAVVPVLLCLLHLLRVAEGLRMTARNGEEKCFLEDVPKDTVIIATFEANIISSLGPFANPSTQSTQIKVSAKKDGIVLNERYFEKAGRYAFTTTSSGEYEICFNIDGRMMSWFGRDIRRYHLDIIIDTAEEDSVEVEIGKDYEGVHRDLFKSLMNVQHVVRDQEYLKTGSAAHFKTSSKTYSLMVWLMILKLVLATVSVAWQATYLKRYFKIKKLI